MEEAQQAEREASAKNAKLDPKLAGWIRKYRGDIYSIFAEMLKEPEVKAAPEGPMRFGALLTLQSAHFLAIAVRMTLRLSPDQLVAIKAGEHQPLVFSLMQFGAAATESLRRWRDVFRGLDSAARMFKSTAISQVAGVYDDNIYSALIQLADEVCYKTFKFKRTDRSLSMLSSRLTRRPVRATELYLTRWVTLCKEIRHLTPTASDTRKALIECFSGNENDANAPFRIFIEQVDNFAGVVDTSPSAVLDLLDDGCLNVSEDFVNQSFEEILKIPFHREDSPAELDDVYTSNVTVNGHRRATAIMLKGPGIKVKELEIKHCGSKGSQLVRLFDAPGDLFVVQFTGRISEMVLKDVEGKVVAARTRVRSAQYLAIDGQDTARILRAYKKI